jgi:hypothetical protein
MGNQFENMNKDEQIDFINHLMMISNFKHLSFNSYPLTSIKQTMMLKILEIFGPKLITLELEDTDESLDEA